MLLAILARQNSFAKQNTLKCAIQTQPMSNTRTVLGSLSCPRLLSSSPANKKDSVRPVAVCGRRVPASVE